MTAVPQPWHSEALLMRAAAMTPEEIGARLGKNHSTVRWALNENGEKQKHRLRSFVQGRVKSLSRRSAAIASSPEAA